MAAHGYEHYGLAPDQEHIHAHEPHQSDVDLNRALEIQLEAGLRDTLQETLIHNWHIFGPIGYNCY